MRGPGELGGIRQSGITNFAYVNLVNDFRMFEAAREDAKFILDNSFEPEFKSIIIRANKEIDNNDFTNS
jgi:RecG-like helicase